MVSNDGGIERLKKIKTIKEEPAQINIKKRFYEQRQRATIPPKD